MRCPRCHRDVPRPTRLCGACGAPLLLGEEVPTAPLDGALDLDRRRGRDGEDAAAFLPVPSAALTPGLLEELAAVEPSDWDFAARPAADEEPEPGPAAADAGDAVPEPEIDALEVHVERAATWRRAAAWTVDGVPFAWAAGAASWRLVREAGAAPPAGIDGALDLFARERVIALSVAAAVVLALVTYTVLAHALAGATLGKRLFGLRVIGPDGGRPSPARSAARSVLAVASAGLLGLGFLLALFTRSGRALHDLIARTWVVKAP
jgi:uncharacterized RDD family membrane protein YckC